MVKRPRRAAKAAQAAVVDVKFTAADIVLRQVDELKPFPNNPKTHPPEQVDALAAAMVEFGFDQPILIDETDTILKGHGRQLAARKAGFNLVPTISRKGLTAAQKIAIVISDNQLPTLGGWDQSLLRVNLTQLAKLDFPLQLTGFDNVRLATFIGSSAPPSSSDPDAQPEIQERATSKRGDVWQMGSHVLHCGDSTKAKLDGDIRLQLTDPPYELNVGGGGIQGKRSYPDKIKAAGIDKFSVDDVRLVAKTNVFFTSKLLIPDYLNLAIGNKLSWDINVMHRMAAMPNTQGHMMTDIDYIMLVGAMAPARGLELKNYSKVLSLGAWERPVPWAKPVEILTKYIRLFSSPGDTVFEPYCGSGSTIIAAEMESRRCIAYEHNPVFVDLAVQRWQKFTGKQATLAGGKKTFDQVVKERAKLAA